MRRGVASATPAAHGFRHGLRHQITQNGRGSTAFSDTVATVRASPGSRGETCRLDLLSFLDHHCLC